VGFQYITLHAQRGVECWWPRPRVRGMEQLEAPPHFVREVRRMPPTSLRPWRSLHRSRRVRTLRTPHIQRFVQYRARNRRRLPLWIFLGRTRYRQPKYI